MGIHTHTNNLSIYVVQQTAYIHKQQQRKFHYKSKEIQMFAVCQTGSFAAIYSAFVVDRAIVSCRIDFPHFGSPVNTNT